MYNNSEGEEVVTITISDDEDDMVVGPPTPGGDESGRSSGSAALPTPPPTVPTMVESRSGRPSSVPMSGPIQNMNLSAGRQSANLAGQHFQFPPSAASRSGRESNGSSSSLPSIFPQPAFGDRNMRRDVDYFMGRINKGREIACLLCEKQFSEHQLLKHVNEKHFFTYRPYKCAQCEFRTGDVEILNTVHFTDSGHEHGINNFELYGEKNENIELVIRIVYEHSLLAHGKTEQEKDAVIERLATATRAMRARRLQPAAQAEAADESDEFEDDGKANAVSVPLPSPCESDIDMDPQSSLTTNNEEPGVTSSTLTMAPLSPIPITHRQARKSIQYPRVATAVQRSPEQDQDCSESMDTTAPFRVINDDLENETGNDQPGSFEVSAIGRGDGAGSAAFNSFPPPLLTPEVDPSGASYSPPPDLTPERNVHAAQGAAADPLPGASSSIQVKIQAWAFTCGFCHRIMPHLKYLQYHAMTSHSAGYAMYKCTLQPDCDFGAWRQKDLREHAVKKHGVPSITVTMATPTAEQKEQMQRIVDSLRAKGFAEPEEIRKVLEKYQ